MKLILIDVTRISIDWTGPTDWFFHALIIIMRLIFLLQMKN